jgi:hypothetical protein
MAKRSKGGKRTTKHSTKPRKRTRRTGTRLLPDWNAPTGGSLIGEVKPSASTAPSETGPTVAGPQLALRPLGAVEPPPGAVTAPQGGEAHLGAASNLTADATVIPAPRPVTPTVYPDSPQGPIIVQNHITINLQSDEFRLFNQNLETLIAQLGRSNEFAGEARDQVVAELRAGREILTAPKPQRDLVHLLLLRPLKWVAAKAGSEVIASLTKKALDWLLSVV